MGSVLLVPYAGALRRPRKPLKGASRATLRAIRKATRRFVVPVERPSSAGRLGFTSRAARGTQEQVVDAAVAADEVGPTTHAKLRCGSVCGSLRLRSR